MGVHAYSEPAHTHMCTQKYRVYTDMYSYLQVSSLNFKLLRFVNSVSPIFPFEVFLFLYSVDLPPLFIFFIFYQLSVTPKCSLLYTPSFFFQLRTPTLNLSQSSLSTLLLHNTSQCNWHQLNLCRVLQPVIERETGKLMIK